jgi:hypothetical protein
MPDVVPQNAQFVAQDAAAPADDDNDDDDWAVSAAAPILPVIMAETMMI